MVNMIRSFLRLALISLLFLGPFEARAEDRDYTIDLDKVVVTASRVEQTYKSSTRNMSIVSAEDITSSGVFEITEAFDVLPAVDVLEYGSLGSSRSVHIRGASSSQTLTLIDGRPINTSRDGAADFDQIPIANIDRIEILRGPASSIYGSNAIGGVINIITKTGRSRQKTQILRKFGSFYTNHLALTHGDENKGFDYFISYDYLSSDGHRDNSDYLSYNTNTRIGYQLNEENHIGLACGYQDIESGAPGKVTSVDSDDREETFKKYIDITYDGSITEDKDLLIKLFHNFDRLEFTETVTPLDKDTHQNKVYGVDAQISQVFFDIFRTSVGLSGQEHRFNSSNSDKHTYNLKALYFETEVTPVDNGSLKIGARWDDYSNFGDKINPSASFNFWVFDTIKFHGLAAKSFRAPTFNDLYSPQKDYGGWGAVGNADLGPEKAVSYEAGLAGYFADSFKTDITFFKTNVDGLLEWTTEDNYWWAPENVNSAERKGVEVEAEFVLKKKLKANFSYTYLEAENKDTKKWMIGRPRNLYKLRLAYSPDPQWELGLNATYKTKRYSNKPNTHFLEHYFVMNSNLSYRMNDYVQILLEAKNIFDRKYQEQMDYPLPGRSFYGGAKVAF